MTQSHTLIVDGNNVGMAAQFVNPTLTDAIGRPTGAIYGLVRSLRPRLAKVQEETGTKNVKLIVAWDSSTSWRKTLLPTYKASRRSSDPNPNLERYHEQMPRIRDLLKILGVSQLTAEDYEADDIAGHISRIVPNQVTLVTNDRDWLQLVSDRVHVWQPMAERYVTTENFSEVTEGCVDAEEFVRLKALCGDKGDDVPGAQGVGDKGGLKYLRGEMKATTAKGDPAKAFTAADEWMRNPDGFDRSKKLVDLRDMHIPVRNFSMKEGAYDQEALINAFMELGFSSVLQNLGGWITPFRLASEASTPG